MTVWLEVKASPLTGLVYRLLLLAARAGLVRPEPALATFRLWILRHARVRVASGPWRPLAEG